MTPTPGDLRAEIARRQILVYTLAAQIGLHPGRLGQMLNERLPMPVDVAARVGAALGLGERELAVG
jgi:plasmid maintenance system antidote protein VapI